jgi:hypothetical protein
VDVLDQVLNRSPVQVECHLRPDSKVDPGDEEIAPRIDEPCHITQAAFRVRWIHVAKEAVRYDDILATQRRDEARIASVCDMPVDSLSKPRFDPNGIVIPVKERCHLLLCQTFKDRRTYQLGSSDGVKAGLGDLNNRCRNI